MKTQTLCFLCLALLLAPSDALYNQLAKNVARKHAVKGKAGVHHKVTRKVSHKVHHVKGKANHRGLEENGEGPTPDADADGGEEEQEEKKPVNQNAVLGAVLGFPLGYVTGQSTLASSGDEDPSTTAMAHGLAGAAAGYLVAQEFEPAEAAAEGDDPDKIQIKEVNPDEAQEDAKKGAMAGLVAGAFGTTFSGSSGGSDGDGGGGGGGGGGGNQVQGPSAMSAKIPIIHSIVAGAVAGAAVGAMKDTLRDFAGKMEKAKADAEAKKNKAAEEEGDSGDAAETVETTPETSG